MIIYLNRLNYYYFIYHNHVNFNYINKLLKYVSMNLYI